MIFHSMSSTAQVAGFQQKDFRFPCLKLRNLKFIVKVKFLRLNFNLLIPLLFNLVEISRRIES